MRGDPRTRRGGFDGPDSRKRRRAAAAAVLVMLLGCLGFTEATGVTNFHGTVIRLFSPEGTLVVEVDDPGVSVKIDGLGHRHHGSGGQGNPPAAGSLYRRGHARTASSCSRNW